MKTSERAAPKPTRKRKDQPTDAQLPALRNIVSGRPIEHGITGMSAHGGLWRTWVSIKGRGWVDGDMSAPRLTDAWREAIEPPAAVGGT